MEGPSQLPALCHQLSGEHTGRWPGLRIQPQVLSLDVKSSVHLPGVGDTACRTRVGGSLLLPLHPFVSMHLHHRYTLVRI